MVSRYRSTWRF